MQFFKDILQSIYGPEYYREIPTESLGKSIRYFVLLAVLLVLITVASMAPAILRDVTTFLKEGSTKLVQQYPSSLKVAITNGQVTTNAKEPYFFPLSKEMKQGSRGDEDFTNFLVIDTKTPFSQATFEKYDTVAWLTKDSLFITSDTQTRAQSLKEIEHFALDKQKLQDFIAKVSPWFAYIGPLLLFFMALIIFLVQLFTLIYVWILAFIFRLVARLFTIELSYSDSYKLTIHAVTLGLILDLLLQLLRPILHIQAIPFMFSAVTFISFLVNVLMQKELWRRKPAPKSVPRKIVKKAKRK